MSFKLYNPQVQVAAGAKVELFLKWTDLQVEFVRIPREQWQTPEYLAKHPLGKIPTLETPEGCIYESNSILRYLARKVGKFYGNTPAETASVDQWLEFANTQLGPNASRVLYPAFGYAQATKEQYQAGKKDLLEALKIIEAYLKDNAFLGAKDISISEISVSNTLRPIFKLVLDGKARAAYPSLTKWFTTISETKQFTAYFGKTWLATQEYVPQFVGGKQQKKQQKPKADKPKEQKKPKEEKKPKEQSKKKEEPKKKQEAKKKKKDEDEEEDEPLVPQQKKKANPLDLLPKSNFVMDDFKRDFCNAADKKASLANLWEKFDTEGWSIWKTHYIRYEGEGKIGYLTCNLKNGYLRNLDHFRKYTFAVLGVYGVEGDYQIEGAWLWRGVDIPEEWKEHQSYDYFTFTKLDAKNPKDQELVANYWLSLTQGDMVEGRPVHEAKWFK